jgi:putative peptide zinc metalloprotease protein
MARSLFSPSWYRVAPLKLRLRSHAEIHRQRFRGEVWYVLQDHQTGRFHRLSPSANLMMSLMDGRRTLDTIWDMVGQKSEGEPPTQDETITLLSQLHGSDLLQGDLPPDFGELGERSSKQARRDLLGRLRNPLALRLPLWDPDRFLDATVDWVRPLFTVWGFLAWVALIVSGVVLAAMHWDQLTAGHVDQLFSLQNVVLIALIYPAIKLLHEAGHAYATKVFGGAVHEVGIMLLILLPTPYVDATSATAFREKWKRVLVGGAGIMVEVALAAIAMIFWVNAEPGLARAAAFNVMLIGSVSTLLFNGNPLLRFDAYYILTDWTEIPNLGARANKYFWYLAQRHLLGLESAEDPATGRGEKKWLFGFAVLSFFYRIVLSLTIAVLVATQLFFVGVALAIVSLAGTFVFPLFKGAKFVLTSPKLHDVRGRAVGVTAGAVFLILASIFAFPMPYGTVAEGVVWVPERSEVRARTSGIIATYLSSPDIAVDEGRPLIEMEDSSLSPRIAVLEAQRDELEIRGSAVRISDRPQADMLAEQVRAIEGSLAAMTERRIDLVLTSAAAGRFIVPGASDLIGRYVRQGDLLGYVVDSSVPGVRVVVEQGDVDLVRARTQSVSLRYVSDPQTTVPASIVRAVPAAQFDLPSTALSTLGGGLVVLDTTSGQPRTLEGIFVFDLAPEQGTGPLLLGSRVYVRFDHGTEPVGYRLLRGLRQVFLSTFNV